jgi:hypothetical protein
MAYVNYQFEKRKRDAEKKRKQEEKRKRKAERKQAKAGETLTPPPSVPAA